MSKREIIVQLLRQYREAESGGSGGDGAGSGDRVPMCPPTWNASYRELERCLHVMSGDAPKQTRQLLARYVDPVVSRRRLIGQRNKATGEVRFANLPAHCEVRSYVKLADADRHANEWDAVVASWPGWVRNQIVEAGLDRLEKLFRGEPYLPVDFLEDVAA